MFYISARSLRQRTHRSFWRLKAHWVSFDLRHFCSERASQLTFAIIKNFFVCILKNILINCVSKLWLAFNPLIIKRFVNRHILELRMNLTKWRHKITSLMTFVQSFGARWILTFTICGQSLIQSIWQVNMIFSRGLLFDDNRWTLLIFNL